jgi:hypothetical protein
VAVFMAWSPVDFWQYLPSLAEIAQIPYRLLAQVDWLGAVLVALAVVALFGKTLDPRHVVVGILLMGALSASYIPTLHSSSVALASVIQNPTEGYGAGAYLYRATAPDAYGGEELPLYTADGWLVSGSRVRIPAQIIAGGSSLHLEGSVPGTLPNGMTLSLLSNGAPFATRFLGLGAFVWDAPLPTDSGAFTLSVVASDFFVPHAINPASTDTRPLSIQIHAARLIGTQPDWTVAPASESFLSPYTVGSELSGRISVSNQRGIVQLPILYYPSLLDIRVDGRAIPYFPVAGPVTTLAAVKLPAGEYEVTAAFTGSPVGNAVSVVAFSLILGCCVVAGIRSLLAGLGMSVTPSSRDFAHSHPTSEVPIHEPSLHWNLAEDASEPD